MAEVNGLRLGEFGQSTEKRCVIVKKRQLVMGEAEYPVEVME